MASLDIKFFNSADKTTQTVSLDTLIQLLSTEQGFYWCDIVNEDINALTAVLARLQLNPEWVDHFDKPDVLPHLRDTPESISFYLYDVMKAESHLDSAKDITEMDHQPFLLIFGINYVITFRKHDVEVIDYVKHHADANFLLEGKTPSFIPFLIAQHCLYNYSRLNLANDNFLDLLEFGVLTGRVSDYILNISIAGYNILTLKKLNANLHIVLLMLVTKRSYVVSSDARAAFHDLLHATLGIRESIDSSRDLLDSIIVSTQADATRKTGEIVRVLTIVSALFMPLALVAGIYGMNFQIPELKWHYGYYFALSLMVFITVFSLSMLKHFGWLPSTNPAEPVTHRKKRRHRSS